MKYTRRTSYQPSLHQQKGFVFKLVHSLLIVAVTVILILLYQGGQLGFLRHFPGKITRFLEDDRGRDDRGWSENNNPGDSRYWRADYRDRSASTWNQDDNYEAAIYSVQLTAAYDSRTLYYWRDELIRNGYKAYLTRSNTSQGMLFKLRVGPYKSRHQAEETRWKLGQYSQNFADGFLVPGE